MDCEWIGWCALKPEAQAAWVQAVGSVIALGIAVGVPVSLHARSRKADARKEVLRARGFALFILPDAEEMLRLFRRAGYVARGEDGDEPDSKAAADVLVIPPQIQERVTQLHELGDAAEKLQRAIAKGLEAKQQLEYEHFYNSEGGEYYDPIEQAIEDLPKPEDAIGTIRDAAKLAEEAIKEMRAMFN
ncbi:hypothetical protein [Stenotrophomonas maltophilia]|uniref:hypothetical protein n=1 Tax=Stenotrophomonas maltophilia TaxID=40324 RepID=UPI0013DCF847|nr:hypothetical protein [Stenotrophomonas maltophilia]